MPSKTPRKEFTIDFTFYARGKRRKPSVSAVFGPEGLRQEDNDAFAKLQQAADDFCKHLVEVGEV